MLILNLVLAFILITTASLTAIFSYLWVDFGIILMLGQSHPLINSLLNITKAADSNRTQLSVFYILIMVILFLCQTYILFKRKEKIHTRYLFLTAGITTLVFGISYPFISRDIFSYLFYSKILLTYHANPFVVAPNQFAGQDLWLSFIHNIDSPYPYGVIYLVYSSIPVAIFTGSRFILDFYGLKLLNAAVFYLSGWLIYLILKRDIKVFSIWYFNPILISELLVNSHNELLMLSLFFASLSFAFKKRYIFALLLFALSALTKIPSIIALPALIPWLHRHPLYFKLMSMVVMLFLLQQDRNIWYYCWVFMFLSFTKLKTISWVLVFSVGLLLLTTYYPFIRYGYWGPPPLVPYTRQLMYFLVVLIFLIEVGQNNLILLADASILMLKRWNLFKKHR